MQKAAYVIAKHGVIGLTKVTALETAKTGVTANTICPGWVLTPLVQKQIEDRATREGTSIEEATQNLLKEKQPSKQFITVEDIGAMVVHLTSRAGNNIRGSATVIDGGWTAQ